jgi:hypothetical protein
VIFPNQEGLNGMLLNVGRGRYRVIVALEGGLYVRLPMLGELSLSRACGLVVDPWRVTKHT